MEINAQKIVSWIILGIGFFGFIIALSQNEFTIAIIILISSLIFWIGYSLLMKETHDSKLFSLVIAGAGLLVSLAIFTHFGVEKISFPQGAIIFHSDGIAKALAVVLFTLIPIVMFKATLGTKSIPSIQNHFHTTQAQVTPKPVEDKIYIDDDVWEEATEEDLFSGEYIEE